MFLSYLASLVLLGFVFWLLFTLIIPLRLFISFIGITSRRSGKRPVWPAALFQAIICVIYAVSIAVISSSYAGREAASYPCIYGFAGFIATYSALGSNAQRKAEGNRDVFSWPMLEEQAAARGAEIGSLAGLLAYFVFFLWPAVVGLIPGMAAFLRWFIGIADWLSCFWIVGIILVLTLLGYILSAGMTALVGGAGLAIAGLGAIGRLFGFPRVRNSRLQQPVR